MLTVGQMARMFEITPKTLRHYDAIGLFSPSAVGEDNQYRYYKPEQMIQLRRILFFRHTGLGLEVIRELVRSGAMDDPVRISHILQEHAASLREEIANKQSLLTSVEEMLGTINQSGGKLMKAQVVTLPAFHVVGMSWRSGDEGTIPDLWGRFNPREGEIQGKLNAQVCYGLCVPIEDGGVEYTAGFESTGTFIPDGMVFKTVPAQTYAWFTHRGSLSGLSKTMEDIYTTWLPQNGYKAVKGIDFELYTERFTDPDDEHSEVDLYIPIEAVEPLI
ncbi:MerR family transcriptional regulator [Paenibacillus sp. SYP-B3998]|uniref:MerR family transcriptional regulator n=1 Tax=Paenibacillus sp. SYP-B3998 TaxID=2678564 RepID=A0A6G3ZUU5_9BACL|nr:GyrI-like domain-containing protein [Paenibacillus sp. SYP-B3998]NEW05187.1 MerR family transcriptional regulator [Paenibacillus sp. SYP-B3998]